MIHTGDLLSHLDSGMAGDILTMVMDILTMVMDILTMTGIIPGDTLIIMEIIIADTMMDTTMVIGMAITDIHTIPIHILLPIIMERERWLLLVRIIPTKIIQGL